MPCPNHPAEVDELIVCWRCRNSFCRNCVAELQTYYFCPDCKPLQVRDLLAGTDMLSPDYAPLWKRLVSWLIDGMVKGSVGVALSFLGQMLTLVVLRSNAPETQMAVSLFFFMTSQTFNVIYEALMLSMVNGQTLGKLAVGIRVTTVDGNRISVQQAWWRSASKVVLTLATCTCGCLSWLLDGAFIFGTERATLHDYLAQTRVMNVR